MFGSHLSIAGSMANALREAESLGLDCVQVFTKNQQQWRVTALEEEVIREWKGELRRMEWEGGRTVSHASYLINLASPDAGLWEKSVGLMRVELERCEALGIRYLVHHPGAFTSATLEEGLGRIGAAYQRLMKETRGFRTISCLENTAGGGSTIGRRFEELARLREMIVERTGEEGRIGVCFDTCHAHAAGYDMSSCQAADATLDELERVCGLGKVRVLHLNDSKGKLGSRLDRHEHIGKGQIGLGGFEAVVNREELRGRPMIMETPKGRTAKGTAWDAMNLRRLRKLVEGRDRGIKGSRDRGIEPE